MAKRSRFSDKLRREREGAEGTLAFNNKEPTDSGAAGIKGAGAAGPGTEGSAAAKKVRQRRLRTESDAAKARKSKLKIEAEPGPDAGAAMTRTGTAKSGKPSDLKKPGHTGGTVSAVTHGAIANANEDDNAGTNAAQLGGESAEEAVRLGREETYSRKLRNQKRRDSRAQAENERNADSFEGYSSKYSEGRTHSGSSAGDADTSHSGKSSAKQAASETSSGRTGSGDASKADTGGASKGTSDTGSNPYSRWRQKQDLKREYAARKGTSAGGSAKSSAEGTKKTAEKAKEAADKAAEFAKEHAHLILIILAIALVIIVISCLFSSCSLMAGSTANTIIGSTFTADYVALEEALQDEIDNIESTYSGYDEYNYDLVEIGHNPYELAALLTVEFEDYTREEVQDRLQEIFDAQYTLTVEEVVETRTRTEERTGIRSVVDEVTGEITYETYTYEVEVEYDYYILNVTLTNSGITAVAYSSDLTDDQLERYALLLETLGNRSDLFEDVTFAVSTGDYLDYDIPGEALTDEKFANMIAEAEKYLGMAYVWGGSSPSTGFDCSGYVSWVINNCGNGWSVGRLTANGLMGICDIITADEAEPGDLIFFQGTYNTSGASHVGIYVGNGMMIHCGNPISYASIETSYWQEHFYCFGRIRD